MTEAARRYHHGNLREALLDAGLELTRAGGPGALAMREATRRAGVSPNAAYRHFADREALLAAVRAAILDQVASQMVEPQPVTTPVAARQALTRVGLGYIGFALAEPGWFETAFGEIDPVDSDPGEEAMLPGPLSRLVDALDACLATGLLDEDRRRGAEWPCWSAVHGFALLALHGPLRGWPIEELQHRASRTVDTVIDGLVAG